MYPESLHNHILYTNRHSNIFKCWVKVKTMSLTYFPMFFFLNIKIYKFYSDFYRTFNAQT